MPICSAFCDGPGRDRTCDLGIKSPLLYQLSYRPHRRVYVRSELEAVDVCVVRCEPVAEGPTGHAHLAEHLVARLDRRRRWILDVFEEHAAAGDPLRQPAEPHA